MKPTLKKNRSLTISKIFILTFMLFMGIGGHMVHAQWTQPASAPPLGNMPLPLTAHTAPQIKDGPLMISMNNLSSNYNFIYNSFALKIPYGGISIGSVLTPTGALGAGDLPGLLHINNAQPGSNVGIRIDNETGIGRPVFVTSSQNARIGLGTLNPAYNFDIPSGTARIGTEPTHWEPSYGLQYPGLLEVGTIQIEGSSSCPPMVGYVLTSLDNQGNACWSPRPGTANSGNIAPPDIIDENWPYGNQNGGFIGNTQQFLNHYQSPNLRQGMWYVTVFGNLGDAGNGAAYNLRVSIRAGSIGQSTMISNGGPSGGNFVSADKVLSIADYPDGTAPFSVSSIIVNGGPDRRLYISLSDGINHHGSSGNLNPSRPIITGVSAYWMGN